MRLTAIIVTIALVASYVPINAESGWVAIVSPGAGERISGQRAEVSVSYNTGSSDVVTRVELDVDGVHYGVKQIGEPTSRGIASFHLDTTGLRNGSHAIVVKVFSGSKLIGSASGGCTVSNQPTDFVPPDVRFVGVRKGQVFAGVAEIEVEAKDLGGSDPLVSIFIDNTLKLIKNTRPYTYSWDTRDYGDGRHVLEALAYDGNGNKGQTASIEVLIQNAASKPGAVGLADASKGRAAASAAKPSSGRQVKVARNGAGEAIVPVERGGKSAAARSAERQPKVSASASNAAGRSDRARSRSGRRSGSGSSKSVEKPVKVASAAKTPPTRPDAPQSPPVGLQESKAAASEAGNPKVSPVAPAEPKVLVPTKSDGPAVTDVTPQPVAASDPTRQAGGPPVPPSTTQPSVEAARISSDVLASLPAGVSAPVKPEIPSNGSPAVTLAGTQSGITSSAVRPEKTAAPAGQRITRPSVPEQKPARLAKAPKPELPTLQPVVQPRKAAIMVQTRTHKGVLVTELRSILETAGGGILSWDNRLKTVVASYRGRKIRIRMGERSARVGADNITLASSPHVNARGRTVVDVRFLKNLLGTRLVVDERTGRCRLVLS